MFRDLGDGAIGIVCDGFEKVAGRDLVCLQIKVYLRGWLGEDRREVDVLVSHCGLILYQSTYRASYRRVRHVMSRVDRVGARVAAPCSLI